MIEDALKEIRLPESFADRLLAFPFPRIEPEVRVDDCPGQTQSVDCQDTHSYFTPLVQHGACDWCFYDWPGRKLRGVNESRVVGVSKRGGRTVFRIWSRFTELAEPDTQSWVENHFLVEKNTFRWIGLDRDKAGQLLVRPHRFSQDRGDLAQVVHRPEPVRLTIGTKWASGDGHNEVVGVSQVAIGDRSWKCLRILSPCQYGKTGGRLPAALAEWYVPDTGRTVFFRRYNGHGYAPPETHRSFESLTGNLEIEFEGRPFRHSYDCIPDIALEKAFG